jgi:lysozyme family protein
MTNFDLTPEQIIQKVIFEEGGFTIDHAGETNFGITLPFYIDMTGNKKATAKDIIALTKPKAAELYMIFYKRLQLDKLKDKKLQYAIFDGCVNHGAGNAVRWIQRSLKIKADGVIGNQTIQAINNVLDSDKLFREFIKTRTIFFAQITQTNSAQNLRFLEGWITRSVKFIDLI